MRWGRVATTVGSRPLRSPGMKSLINADQGRAGLSRAWRRRRSRPSSGRWPAWPCCARHRPGPRHLGLLGFLGLLRTVGAAAGLPDAAVRLDVVDALLDGRQPAPGDGSVVGPLDRGPVSY